MKKFLLSICLGSIFLGLAGFVNLMTPALADQPGMRYHLKAEDLPVPYATQSVSRSSRHIDRPEGRQPVAPDGFTVTLFADGLTMARNLIVAENGDVFLAESHFDRVTRLRDRNGDHLMDDYDAVDFEFNMPHGLDIYEGDLYVADHDRIYRFDDLNILKPPVPLGRKGIFGDSGGHWTRNIAISPDGKKLYAAIGSRSNLSEEASPRATVQEFTITKTGNLTKQRDFATGLRNPVGIAFHPKTGMLYTVVNERDGMGDGLVPDYLTHLQEGDFYGWPYAYSGRLPQPGFAKKRPDLVARAKKPDIFFQAHSAPLGLTFLADADVPESWKDDALVALHGSWNAARPTGYKVVRAVFESGQPTGEYVDFLTGFRVNSDQPDQPAQVWGRPVGVAVTPDGAILVSDDVGGTIWHISR